MAKGKKKMQTVEPRLEEQHTEVSETKENEHHLKTTCQAQLTEYFENRRSQIHKSPLFPIQEKNSICSTQHASKHPETLASNLQLTTEENKEKQIMYFGPGEKKPHEDTGSLTVLPNKSEQGTRAKAKVSNTKEKKPHDDTGSLTVLPNKSEQGTHAKAKVSNTKAECKPAQKNRKVTDYYPVRRSARKSEADLKSEEQRHIDDLILNNVEDGLKVKYIEGKGRGVFTDREFNKGQFVVEYHGDLLQIADAKIKEAQYDLDPTKGCYMYYFRYKNHTYCVDATKETDRLGRLLNHSKNGNCQTRVHNINGIPHLILVASRDIKKEEELLYDYGDRSKEAIAAHPWLKY